MALTEIIRGVLRITDEDGVLNSGISVVNIVTLLAVCGVIVCVESRLDAYRLNREKAGWTEETGYPEGYRHEYEKEKDKK